MPNSDIFTKCGICKGVGWVEGPRPSMDEPPPNIWCDWCHGRGYMLTDLGRDVARVVRMMQEEDAHV